MTRDNDSGSNLVWFISGAVMGAAVALLYAPQPGEHTRRLIKKKASQGRDLVADRGRDLMDKGRSLYEQGRGLADETAEMFEHGRDLIDN